MFGGLLMCWVLVLDVDMVFVFVIARLLHCVGCEVIVVVYMDRPIVSFFKVIFILVILFLLFSLILVYLGYGYWVLIVVIVF